MITGIPRFMPEEGVKRACDRGMRWRFSASGDLIGNDDPYSEHDGARCIIWYQLLYVLELSFSKAQLVSCYNSLEQLREAAYKAILSEESISILAGRTLIQLRNASRSRISPTFPQCCASGTHRSTSSRPALRVLHFRNAPRSQIASERSRA